MINYTNTFSILSKRSPFISNNCLKLRHQFDNRQESSYSCKYSSKMSNTMPNSLNFPRRILNYNSNSERNNKNYKVSHRILLKLKSL